MCDNEENGVAFKGDIEWLPDISVDNFADKTRAAYFLSHLHRDHMTGLHNSSDLNRISKIYMSTVTRIIFRNKYNWIFNQLQGAIEVIETERPYSIKVNGKKVAEVTFIPVTHMPGAVMFLFKTGEKTILYTGDFVMNGHQLKEFAQLDSMRENGSPITIDLLYYDATLRTKKRFRYNKNIPERSQCIIDAADTIREWLDKDKSNAVAIFKYYDYAYEELFQGIYENLDRKEMIYLHDSNQRDVYRDILREDERVCYNTTQKSRIHICKFKHNDTVRDHELCMVGGGSYTNYMHIMVFAFPCRTTAIKHIRNNDCILTFPTHCSDSQLTNFLECIRPLKAIPFPEQDEVADDDDDAGPSTPRKGIKRKAPPNKPRKENPKSKKTIKKPTTMRPL